jgi:hypothetical protein
VARRLREIKNTSGLSTERLAEQTGLPFDRVKAYLGLFGASDHLLEFFEQHDVPLKAAVEFVRYERATNEARSRRLMVRYRDKPISREEIIRLRKQETEQDGTAEHQPTPPKRRSLASQLRAAWEKDPQGTRAELETALESIGFRLIPTKKGAEPTGAAAPKC